MGVTKLMSGQSWDLLSTVTKFVCVSLSRSLLRQGLLRLNLWPVVCDSTTGESNMSTMGSTAVNPDGNNSAVLYIEMDTYAHPVAFPTGGWGEDIPV